MSSNDVASPPDHVGAAGGTATRGLRDLECLLLLLADDVRSGFFAPPLPLFMFFLRPPSLLVRAVVNRFDAMVSSRGDGSEAVLRGVLPLNVDDSVFDVVNIVLGSRGVFG